jgi:RHS repeat-associated protein
VGTVRLLTDSTGTVTDTYDYDAWGNAVNTTGSTPNVYLYRGEQYDADLGLYYLRARCFNPATGRFLARDPAAGQVRNPITRHKYLYGNGDPVGNSDPSGRGGGVGTWPGAWPETTATPGRSTSEYVRMYTFFALPFIGMFAEVVVPSADDINCVWVAADSVVEAAYMRAVLSDFVWVTPNRPPGRPGSGNLPPSMPPRNLPQPGGGKCGACNCAIKCYITDYSSGQNEERFGGWAFGRAKGQSLGDCMNNAQANFNQTVGAPGARGKHCDFNIKNVWRGKYCKLP